MDRVRAEIEEKLLNRLGNLNARKIPFLEKDNNQLFLDICRVTDFLPDDVLLVERFHCIKNNIRELLICPYCREKRSYVRYRAYLDTCGKASCGLKLRYSNEDNLIKTSSANIKVKREGEFWFNEELSKLDNYGGVEIKEPYLNFSSKELIINCLNIIADTKELEYKFENKDLMMRYKLLKMGKGICLECGKEHLNFNFVRNEFDSSCSKECSKSLFERKRIEEMSDWLEKDILGDFKLLEMRDLITKAPVKLQCINGHIFTRWMQGDRKQNIVCHECNPLGSSLENEVVKMLEELGIKNIIRNSRKIIYPLELDIFCPDYNIAIEFNGSYWHSYNRKETKKEKERHLIKYLKCQELGINLIQITENDWVNKKSQVELLLKARFGLLEEIKEYVINKVDSKIAKEFYLEFGMRYVKTENHYGLFEDGLIGVISVDNGILINWSYLKEGVLEKMIEDVSINEVISYNMDGDGLKGFVRQEVIKPDFSFINNGRSVSRNQCQKHRLSSLLGDSYDNNLSMCQNMFNTGHRRIWDAGRTRWKR